jgi:sirohydrochlorin cobaltochelatase
VSDEVFSKAALVLLGHGTTRNAESAAPVYQHAAALRERRLFGEVREAFWKQKPDIFQVLESLNSSCVYIVPLFMSDGYFSGQVIPREIGFGEREPQGSPGILARKGKRFVYCKPVGTHERMSGVLLDRALRVVSESGVSSAPLPADTTLFIAGHGTERNDNSRQEVEKHVSLLRARSLFFAVHAVFLEESPRVGECYRMTQTPNIVMVPFFISDGLHVREDIPVLLGEAQAAVRERLASGKETWLNPTEKNGRRVWLARSVGTDPLMTDLIVERAREGASVSALKPRL